MQIYLARGIAAPADRVWAVMADLANRPRVMTAFGRIQAATLGRLFIGATRRALETDLADIARAAESPSS